MIKNYTSSVPPERSVTYIEKRLVGHGAKNIMKTYDSNGQLGGLLFVMSVDGMDVGFNIKAKIDRITKKLSEKVKRARKDTIKKIKVQAERTAWRIIADEIDIQLTKIELDQVEMLEAFLPYVYDSGKHQTFFEKVKEGNLKLLRS